VFTHPDLLHQRVDVIRQTLTAEAIASGRAAETRPAQTPRLSRGWLATVLTGLVALLSRA